MDEMEQRLRASFGKQSMMATLGASMEAVAEGRVTLAAPIAAHVQQQHGYAHAGLAFALRDLKAGEVLTWSDYRFVRPNAGVPVSDKPALINRKLARDVTQYDPITYDDLAPR